jgi:hypothetical protein
MRTAEVSSLIRRAAGQVSLGLAQRGAQNARARVRVESGFLQSTIEAVVVDAVSAALTASAPYAMVIEQLAPYLLPGAVDAGADLPSVAQEAGREFE